MHIPGGGDGGSHFAVPLFPLSLSHPWMRNLISKGNEIAYHQITIIPPPPISMINEELEVAEDILPIPNPLASFTKLVSWQAEIICNCLVFLSSPLFSVLSLLSDSFRRAEEAKHSVDSAVTGVPSKVARGSTLLLRKLCLGFLGAAYVCLVVTAAMGVAVIMGVGLVQLWVDEPVCVRESFYFDYTQLHPKAVFTFQEYNNIPVGHTFYVSLLFLMPESDYNLEIGMFQVTAELFSTSGKVIEKSSHPCMLQFRSLPIRFVRSCLMSIPLLLGITDETQRISIPMLNHKERYPRTEAIKITLMPRAGTSFLPQLYEAEILINSELPWSKDVVRKWKWTFYVWTSLYLYIALLVVLACCFRPLIFPVITARFTDRRQRDMTTEVAREPREKGREDRDIPESLRRWQQSRSKRKAMLLQGIYPEPVGSSASSISVTREDTSATAKDVGDSESVCSRG